jgi:hypothetical protein
MCFWYDKIIVALPQHQRSMREKGHNLEANFHKKRDGMVFASGASEPCGSVSYSRGLHQVRSKFES